jgi:aspartate/methionine/tyrosine aminotransferase
LRTETNRGAADVSDEIYGGASAWGGADVVAGSEAAKAARSSAPVVARDLLGWEGLGDRLHITYAISKDFALSGLRMGVLYTECEPALLPLQKLNDLCQVSSHTQAVMAEVLQDVGWMAEFERETRARLRSRHAELAAVLDRVEIPHLRSEAGLFTWMDLRAWLRVQDGPSAAQQVGVPCPFGLIFTYVTPVLVNQQLSDCCRPPRRRSGPWACG